MSILNLKARPEILKIGGTSINFASFNKITSDEYLIRSNNERIFELMNPENRYCKQSIFDSILKYKEIANKDIFTFSNFSSLIRDLMSDNNNKFSKSKIELLKKYCKDNDPILLNKIRMALIDDLKGYPLVARLTNDSSNVIDFYFDTTKSYDEKTIQGIIISEDQGFVNKSNFILTAFVNTKYIINSILDASFSYKADEYVDYDPIISKIEDEAKISLWAAIVRDNIRMINTEKLMSMMNLLAKSDFSFVNASANVFSNSSDEKAIKFAKDFTINYSENIKEINKCDGNTETSTDFGTIFNIIKYLDVNPISLLSIIEPNDNVVNNIIKAIFPEYIKCNTYTFASSKKLKEESDDKNERNINIKNSILVGRILPLVFFIGYYIQDGEKYRTICKIDSALEEIAHNNQYVFNQSDGSVQINDIHFNNDEFYDSLRTAFKNPLNTTKKVKSLLEHAIFIPITEPQEAAIEGENNVSD